MGLIDLENLKHNIATTKALGGKNPDNGVALGGQWGTDGAPVGGDENAAKPAITGAAGNKAENAVKKGLPGLKNNDDSSHRTQNTRNVGGAGANGTDEVDKEALTEEEV